MFLTPDSQKQVLAKLRKALNDCGNIPVADPGSQLPIYITRQQNKQTLSWVLKVNCRLDDELVDTLIVANEVNTLDRITFDEDKNE